MDSIPSLHCFVDFTKPDSLRNRPLVVESRALYVCEYYMSIWSPIFRDMFSAELKSSKEIVLPGKRYQHVLEFLDCIYPQQKEINGNEVVSAAISGTLVISINIVATSLQLVRRLLQVFDTCNSIAVCLQTCKAIATSMQ